MVARQWTQELEEQYSNRSPVYMTGFQQPVSQGVISHLDVQVPVGSPWLNPPISRVIVLQGELEKSFMNILDLQQSASVLFRMDMETGHPQIVSTKRRAVSKYLKRATHLATGLTIFSGLIFSSSLTLLFVELMGKTIIHPLFWTVIALGSGGVFGQNLMYLFGILRGKLATTC